MNADEKLFGVRRNIFFLGLVSFFNDFSAEMVQSVMPVFLTTVLGAPAFAVGFIDGAADAAASVLKLISGWVSDRIRRRKLPAMIGYALSVSLRFFYALAQNFWQIFGLRIGDRIGKGLRDSPRDALIAESAPRAELGVSYGFHRAMDNLGATVGPLIAFFLLPFLGGNYRMLFLVGFVLGLLAIASFVFVKETRKDEGDGKPPARPRLNWDIFRTHRRFVIIVFTIFLFGLGSLPIALVLLKAKDIGFLGGVPLMYFVYNAAFVLTSIPLGKLADRIGSRAVIAFGFVLAALGYLGLAHTVHVAALALFFVVLGVYSAATDGVERMLAAQSLEGNLIATGQGFLNMAIGFSSLGAGVIGGILWTAVSDAAALQYAAALSAVGCAAFLFVSKGKE